MKWQRIIKYCAIAFAFFLIGSILSGVMFGINSVFNIFESRSNDLKEMFVIDINDSVNILNVDVNKINLRIENSNDFRIEISDSNRISYSDDGNKLVIDEKINLFDDECELVIYIPGDKVFNKLDITTDIGSVNVDKINTDKLEMELGMGRVNIDSLNVYTSADIDSGVGEFIICEGSINNLELDMGVGDVSISSVVLGKSEINSGIGRLRLNLVGSIDDYKLEIDGGIGSIKVDDKSISEGVYGTGNNYIDIDGGVGDVEAKFVS